MSQLVTQTTTYGLNSDQYSISTLSGVGGVLEIMAGNPHDEVTAPTPIADFKSDQSVKFYGIADLSNGVTLPEKVIGTKLLADKSVTSAKIAKNVNIVGNLTGTASRAIADGEGNNIINTYATQTFANTLAPKANPTFTGTVTVPTPSTSDNSTKAASTAFVKAQGYATLANPTFTGTVSVPTPSTSDNSTKAASTAFVKAQNYVTNSVMQSNLANYLPLTGGTVSGNVTVSGIIATGDARARQWYTTDTTYGYYYLTIGVDDWDVGSRIQMMTADSPNMPSAITLTSGTNQLQVTKTAFVAGGKNIVRSVNGTVAGTDGNVTLGKGVYITETWKSGTSWYRVWSDGYIEQGGFTTTSNAVSLPKPFTTTNYTANATMVTTGFNGDVFILAKTTTTIRVKAQGADNNDYTSKGVSWFVCGY